jgi:hypothetical protein
LPPLCPSVSHRQRVSLKKAIAAIKILGYHKKSIDDRQSVEASYSAMEKTAQTWMVDSPAKLIDLLGGTRAVAELFDPPAEVTAVGNWRRSGFPSWARPHIAARARAIGIPFSESLVAPKRWGSGN